MIRYLFFSLILMFSFASKAEEVYVQLKKEASLGNLKVQLGDIAEVVSNDPKTSEEILALQVLELNSLVTPIRLDKTEIQKLLNKKYLGTYVFVWGSEDSVTLTGKKRTISLSDAADKVASWILENMQSETEKAEVLALSRLELENVPVGKVEQRPMFSDMRRSFQKISVPLEILVDGDVVATLVLQFKIKGLQTTTPLGVHHNKNLPSSSDNSIVEKNNLESANSTVAYVVRKDQKIQVILDAGFMHIESEGIALSDGKAGEEVRVQRIDNNEIFTGVVSAPGVVTLGDV